MCHKGQKDTKELIIARKQHAQVIDVTTSRHFIFHWSDDDFTIAAEPACPPDK